MRAASRPETLIRRQQFPMGKFFLIILAISIALVLGTAVLVTYF
jgi:hypothetical protein